MIRPTVGRVVLFTPSTSEGELAQAYGHPLAALITHVWSNTLVNLAVFDATGKHFPKGSVQLLQDDEPRPECGHFCEWMPYQKGQASKTEELERQAALKAHGIETH